MKFIYTYFIKTGETGHGKEAMNDDESADSWIPYLNDEYPETYNWTVKYYPAY